MLEARLEDEDDEDAVEEDEDEEDEDPLESPCGGGGGGPFSSLLRMEEARLCALDVSPDCTSEIRLLRSLRKGSLEELDELVELDELEESVALEEVSDASSVFSLAARVCAVVVSPLATALSRLWTSAPKLDDEDEEDDDPDVDDVVEPLCPELELDCQP